MNSSIERIRDVFNHPNADNLELVKVLGYQCVVPKGKYKVGDVIVYIRPDSVLPKDKSWATVFLCYAPKRVKSIRLRNEWSDGIIVDLSIFDFVAEEGTCVDDLIGVTHYDTSTPNNINAKKTWLPYGICKTDEDRFENIVNKIPYGELCDVTLKIDGQSCSIYYNVEDDVFGILSRSMDLKTDIVNKYTSHLEKRIDVSKFIEFCKRKKKSICLRGESYGNGIQNSSLNPHSKMSDNIAFFSCWLIDEKRYANKGDEFYYINICNELGFEIVPTLRKDVELTKELIKYYHTENKSIDLYKYGMSKEQKFEGVVIKHNKGSFKVINKYYDSKNNN